MSVPAFIDISEEDQVRSWATGAARAGLGKPLRGEGPSWGRAGAGRAGGMPTRGAGSRAERRSSRLHERQWEGREAGCAFRPGAA